MQKIHANELHANIGYPVEYRMHVNANHRHYIIKGTLEVCENYTMEKSKQKYLHKVAEKRNTKMD